MYFYKNYNLLGNIMKNIDRRPYLRFLTNIGAVPPLLLCATIAIILIFFPRTAETIFDYNNIGVVLVFCTLFILIINLFYNKLKKLILDDAIASSDFKEKVKNRNHLKIIK